VPVTVQIRFIDCDELITEEREDAELNKLREQLREAKQQLRISQAALAKLIKTKTQYPF
jgi:hypothetical protein